MNTLTCPGRVPTRVSLSLILLGVLGLLAGCPSQSTQKQSAPPPMARAATFHGVVYGGRQPIQGATVVAYAAGTTAGAVPTQIGTAVSSGPGGTFTITFSPAPTTGQVVYAVAHGGVSITGGSNNPAIGLMTVAGIQNSRLAPVAGTVNVNELSTVAATATLKHYIHFVDCTTITGNTQTGTCLALPGATGLAAKAATLTRLVNVESGQASAFLAANSTTAGSPLTATAEKLGTLASVLAACVNAVTTTTPNACTNLFQTTGGNPDTLQAAWLVARMPAVDLKARAIFALTPTTPVFAPVLATVPGTTAAGFWTLAGERYAFTANSNGNDVSMYRLGAVGGALTSVAGISCGTGLPSNCVAAGNLPRSVAVDPTGRYAYVANGIGNDVSMYTIDTATGALSPVAGSACNGTSATNCVAAGDHPNSVAVDPTGRYVYVANFSGNDVSMYRLGAGGALTSMAGISCGTGLPTNCVAAGAIPFSVTVDPTGRYVYVANQTGNDVSMYTIGAGGALSPLAGSACGGVTGVNNCVAAGHYPVSVTVDPTGRYVYVANGNGDDVSMYTIGAGGALSALAGSACGDVTGVNNCVAAGDNPNSVTVDPTGRYVYVANFNGNDVSMYRLGVGGALTSMAGISCGTGLPTNCVAAGATPLSVTVDPTGRYVYVANQVGNDVSMYTIGAGGALSVLAGSACGDVTGVNNCVAAGDEPNSVTVDPTGRYVYVANFNGNDVSMYTIGTPGALNAVAGSACGSVTGVTNCVAAGDHPNSVAVDPTGRYVYVVNAAGDDVSMYTIGAGGVLSPVAGSACGGVTGVNNCVAAGRNPISVAVDPTGRYVYVANISGNDVSMYTIDTATGALSPVAGSACSGVRGVNNCVDAGSIPISVAVDPTGRYVYVANQTGYDVSMYTIGAGGALNAVAGSACNGVTGVNNCVAAGDEPISVTVDPTGRYVYVANEFGNDVSMYRLGAGGALSPVAGSACGGVTGVNNCVAAGASPQSVTVDPTGRYVYVANEFGNDVSMYRLGADGALSPVAGSACGDVTGVNNCVAAGSIPQSVAVDPTGRYVYVANWTGVSMYTIGAGGALTANGTPVAASSSPISIVVGP